MKKVCCAGCRETFDADTMTDVARGDEIVLLCPRCVFVLALYISNGIKRDFEYGSLHPSVINSKYRKILENEFCKNPHEAYKKYLGKMIEDQEIKRRIIHVSEDVILNLGKFPFVFVAPKEAGKFNFSPGVDVTLDAGDLKITRKLYGFCNIAGRHLRKYGQSSTRTVLFLPEVYDAV